MGKLQWPGVAQNVLHRENTFLGQQKKVTDPNASGSKLGNLTLDTFASLKPFYSQMYCCLLSVAVMVN